MKAVVVVSDEALGGVPAFARGIRDRGLRPLLITGPLPDAKLKGFREAYADLATVEDPYDPAVLMETATELARGHQLEALFSCYDGLVVPAARAAAALGLPHPDLEGLVHSRNKFESRRATRRHGLPTPRFSLLTDAADLPKAAEEVGFPAVLKPLNGLASHRVRRVDDEEQLVRAFESASRRLLSGSFAGNYRNLPAPQPGSGSGGAGLLLLEEFLEGDEFSAEVLVRDNEVHRIALFHKFLIDPQGFLERGFTRPSFGLESRTEAVWEHIEDCLVALGVNNAAAHVEIIDTADGARLVEVNAGRAGGQILVMAVRESTGIDLIDEILGLQLGLPRPRPSPPKLTGRVTTLTVFPPRSGRLEAIDGLDLLSDLPGVVGVVPFCAPGDVLRVDEQEIFAVNLLVEGGDAQSLRALLQEADRLVKFNLSPLGVEWAEMTW